MYSTYNITLEESISKLKTSTGFDKDLVEITQEGLLDNAVSILKNTFNTLRLSLKQITKINNNKLKFNPNGISKFNNSKFKSNYVYLVDQPVSVPVGLNGTMVNYINANNNLVNSVSDINELLNQLRIDVGRILSTENGINEPSLFNDLKYKVKDTEVKNSTKQLANLREGDDYTAERKYGEVFKNNTEFNESIDAIKHSVNTLNKINYRDVNVNVNTCMDYINDLISLTNKGYSKVLIKKIGDSVAIVAEVVESYSACVFNTQMISSVMETNVNEIGKLI